MDSQQQAVPSGAGHGRKAMASVGHKAKFRLTRWIVRRRARWAYFALKLWPAALTVVVIAWALRHVPPRIGPWLYYASTGTVLVYRSMELVESTWKARSRWQRLR